MFIVVELFIIIIGRFTGTLGLLYLLVLCGHKQKLKLKEVIFIAYGGMIRGAIAYALVLTIDKDMEQRNVIITTSLTLVAITTICFGSFMPLVQKWLVPPTTDDMHEYDKKDKKKKNLDGNVEDEG